MRGTCAALAVLYLGFRWLVPMAGWQQRVPAANGHSVMQRSHPSRHAALMTVEPHWAPAVRETRARIPEADETTTCLPDGRWPAGAGTWVIPLRI